VGIGFQQDWREQRHWMNEKENKGNHFWIEFYGSDSKWDIMESIETGE